MHLTRFSSAVAILIAMSLSTASYSQEKKEVLVRVASVTRGRTTQELSLTADVGPHARVTVVPKVSGSLEEIEVELGDWVGAGEVIARIEDREYVLGVKQAEAAFTAARSQWNLAKATAQIEFLSNLEQVEAALKVAQANLHKIKKGARKEEVERAEAAYTQALENADAMEKDLSRATDNYEKGAISDQQFDRAELQFKVAQAQLESAKASLDLIKKGAREEEITVAEAQVEQIQAQLKNLESLRQARSWETQIKSAEAGTQQAEVALGLARIRLDNCTIQAPVSGIISKRFVDVGAIVGPTQPLVSIVNVDIVKLLTHVSAEYIDLVKATQKVAVKVDAYLEKVFQVEGINISPVIDPLSRKMEVEIMISNEDHVMKPGMFPRVTLLVLRDDTLVIPKTAVVTKDGQKQAFAIRDDKAHLQRISVGLAEDDLVEVLSGLEEGELVVIAGPSDLEDGDTVMIEEVNKG